MQVIQKYVPETYNLYVCSDLHLGSPNVSEEAIQEMVTAIANDPIGYMANIGDNCECIGPVDKRYSFSNTKHQTAQNQADRVIELLTPIADKIIAIGMGNHEHKIINTINIAEYIAKGLNCPMGHPQYVTQMFNQETNELMHKFHFFHGYKSVYSQSKCDFQKEGNMKSALKMILSNCGFQDCIAHFMGHIHKFILAKPSIENRGPQLTTTLNKKLKQNYINHAAQNAHHISPDSRWYSATGSFMKTFSDPESGYISYAELAGYPPAEIGYLKATIRFGVFQGVEAVIL